MLYLVRFNLTTPIWKGNIMSSNAPLKAELRTRVGKGSSRELRRNGLIPAVIYGNKQAPISIAVSYKEIFQRIYGGGFKSTVTSIELNGETIAVLPKDYQLDPVRDFPRHVDFLRVTAQSVVEVDVPIHFLNSEKAPGVVKGGSLNIISHSIHLLAPANAIPEFIEVDVKDLDFGSTLHAEDIALPANVSLNPHFTETTIVSVSGADTAEDQA